jgi:hypothetical protein
MDLICFEVGMIFSELCVIVPADLLVENISRPLIM